MVLQEALFEANNCLLQSRQEKNPYRIYENIKKGNYSRKAIILHPLSVFICVHLWFKNSLFKLNPSSVVRAESLP